MKSGKLIKNAFANIVITGAGLFFVLRTLVVLRRGFLFDRQLGKHIERENSLTV